MQQPQRQTAVSQNGRFSHIKTWLKRDWFVLLLFILLTIALTWPLLARLGDNWLAIRDRDTYVKLWDQWWLQRQIDTGQSFFYTTDLFYPIGLDLSFHSISWIVTPVSWLLTPLLGSIDAYNVTILWAIFSSAYAAYLLIQYLVDNRAAAFIGGFIYSFAPYHVSHAGGHPDLVHLAPIPLAALLLLIAFRNGRSWPAAVGTAVMLGIAAFTSLYIMVFALLTVGLLFVFVGLEQQRWRSSRYWRMALWLGGLTAVLLSIRLWSIFANPAALGQMIEAKYFNDLGQTDLRSLILPSQYNPIFSPFVMPISETLGINRKWPAYLGFLPLLLTLVAVTWQKRRQEVAIWFLMGLMFLTFALGPVLRLNGVLREDIVLPASYLTWFPPIRAVARPDFFILGLLLPLGVLAAYGFTYIWQRLTAVPHPKTWQSLFLFTVTFFLIFEFWNGSFPGSPVEIHPFYEQLSQEEENFALVELPMGRGESKAYLFYQIFHQKPIVEGLSARTPPAAYDYIVSNSLLINWRYQIPFDCEVMGAELDAAAAQLIQDNFRYVIIHNDPENDPFSAYFQMPPVFQDETLTVYAVDDLAERPFCP